MNTGNRRIGKRIKEARLRKGITQAELEEEIGCTAAYISRIETGKKEASLAFFIRIANVLGSSADSLLMDVLENNTAAWDGEIIYLLEDCTNDEKRIILDTLFALKQALKKRVG